MQMGMLVVIETAALCAALFGLCLLGTGTDDKNLKSFSSYPDQVQDMVRSCPEFQGKFREPNVLASFASNLALFSVLFLALGWFVRTDSYITNFCSLSIMGQVLNLFDFAVIDLMWWRNSERIRFSGIPDKELYRDATKHTLAFGRGVLMFLLIALIEAYLLAIV